MFLNFKKSFLKFVLHNSLFGKDGVISPFSQYDATNFRTYEPNKFKVEAFTFDLRPVSSFRAMR